MTKVGSFGSQCELFNAFIDKVAESGNMDKVLSYADHRQRKELKKSGRRECRRITGNGSNVGVIYVALLYQTYAYIRF